MRCLMETRIGGNDLHRYMMIRQMLRILLKALLVIPTLVQQRIPSGDPDIDRRSIQSL